MGSSHLDGRCTSFHAWVGTGGGVLFEVWGNDRLATSVVVRGTVPHRRITAAGTGPQYGHLADLSTVDRVTYD